MALDDVDLGIDARLRHLVLGGSLEGLEVLQRLVLLATEHLAAGGTELGRQQQVGIRARLGEVLERLLRFGILLKPLQRIGATDDGNVRERGIVTGLDQLVVDLQSLLVLGGVINRRVVVGLRETETERGADLRRTIVADGGLEILGADRVHQNLVRGGRVPLLIILPGVETHHGDCDDKQHRQRGLTFLHPPVPDREQLRRGLHEGRQVLVRDLGGFDFFTHGLHYLVLCSIDGTARPTDPGSSRRALPRAPRFD